MSKERFQNPACGDELTLRLFTFNSNNRSNVQSIQDVKIYFMDPSAVTTTNPDGRVLVQTVPSSEIQLLTTGEYAVTIYLDPSTYNIGRYLDVWSVTFMPGECASAEIENTFKVFSQLWFTTPTPPVYDFNFNFRPNRIRKGSRRYLLIQVTPNVPKGADILPYYENLATNSELRVSIELACGDCVPAEQDLRLVVDRQLVNYREQGYGFYFIDTDQFEEGIYNIWFETVLGDSTYVSEKNALQIYS